MKESLLELDEEEAIATIEEKEEMIQSTMDEIADTAIEAEMKAIETSAQNIKKMSSEIASEVVEEIKTTKTEEKPKTEEKKTTAKKKATTKKTTGKKTTKKKTSSKKKTTNKKSK